MMKIKLNIFIIFSLLLLTTCQSARDGLVGEKRGNTDEFLVKKKNPLSFPPDFENLPEPTTLNKDNNQEESEISLKEILTKGSNTESTVTLSESPDSSLEKSILEKIKSN